MNVLIAASEMTPFAGEDVLAESVAALAGGLRNQGVEAAVAIPCHRGVREGLGRKLSPSGTRFTVRLGEAIHTCEVFEARAPDGTQVFFLARDEFFDRTGLYGAGGHAYEDNAARFIFFCKGVVELARRMSPAPDVLHAVDWQAALAPVFARHWKLPCATVLQVRDIGYQGNFWSCDFAFTNLPPETFSATGVEFYGSLNFLKGGILAADRVVFPGSITLADALTPEGGCGLDAVLREQFAKLTGISDGLDVTRWNPETDSSLATNYGASNMAGKQNCREALLESAGLKPAAQGPVFAWNTSGLKNGAAALLPPALDRLLANTDARVIINGPVPDAQVEALLTAELKQRDLVAWRRDTADDHFPSLIAGADALLVPGHPTPEGGEQVVKAMRYGCVPVLLDGPGVGGLARHHEASTGEGEAVLFHEASPDALLDALRATTALFDQPAHWEVLRRNAMAKEVSRDASAARMLELYRSL